MDIKQFKSNNIDNVKKITPDVYKDTLELSIPFFVFHKMLFQKGEEILTKEFGLSQSELDVLGSLYYGGGEDFSLSPTALYDIMLFSSGGMTKVLKKLESKNYIQRVENKDDKRSKLVQITDLGKQITSNALKDILNFEDIYFSKLDKIEQKEFKRLLDKMIS